MKMYIKHAFAFSKGEEKKTLLLGLTTEEDIIIKDDVIFKGKYEGKINWDLLLGFWVKLKHVNNRLGNWGKFYLIIKKYY